VKRPKRAIRYFSQALVHDPAFVRSLQQRCALYYDLRQWDKMTPDCESLRKIDPKDVTVVHYIAVFHFRHQDYAAALADIEVMRAIEPAYPFIHSIRAMIFARQGDTEKALEEYREYKRLNRETEHSPAKRNRNRDMEAEELITWSDIVLLDNPNEAASYLARAKAEYDIGRFDEAVVDAAKAQDLRADLPGSYALLAAVCAMRGDLSEALSELDRGVRASPGDLQLQAMRAKVRRALGDVEQAKTEMESVVRLDPRCAAAYVEWGDDLARQNQFDDALHIYDRVLELAPFCPEAVLGRARVYANREDWDKAVPEFQKFAALRPDDAQVHYFLALVCDCRRDGAGTLNELNQVLEIDPEHVEALFWRARLLLKGENRLESALVDACEYVRLKPHDHRGFLLRGTIFTFLGKWEEGFADLDESIKLNSQDGEYYFFRAYVKCRYAEWLAKSRKTHRAEPSDGQGAKSAESNVQESPAFDHSIAKNIGNAHQTENPPSASNVSDVNTSPPVTTYGWLKNTLADPAKSMLDERYSDKELPKSTLEEALADLNQAIKLEPDNAKYHQTRAEVCAELADDDAALVSWDALVRLDPKNVDALIDRGLARTRKKQFDEALADFAKVLELDPKNQTVYYYRANVYRQKGDSEKADAELAKARELLDKR
jgi:tetratricopeptide (TPR) repeat protein